MNMNIETTNKLLDTAKELDSRSSIHPKRWFENWSEIYARRALRAHKKYDKSLIHMRWYLKREKENNITNTTIRSEESLETAKKLASQESNPEPLSEHFAKFALSYQSYLTRWEQGFVEKLGCMKIALEMEKDQKNRKELETIVKKLASRNSNPEPQSEYHAKRALEAYRERNRHLTSMKKNLKEEKKSLASQNSNPGPDQPTLQTLREKHKEETLKEQKAQPQIKRGRSR